MKSLSGFQLTPVRVVALALPIVWLVLPDGIPFVYASCGTAASCTITSTTSSGASCGTGTPQEVVIISTAIEQEPGGGKCGFTLAVKLDVNGNCTLCWHSWCTHGPNNPNQCDTCEGDFGAGPEDTKKWTVSCDSCGDNPIVSLKVKNGCPGCPTGLNPVASGTLNCNGAS